MWIADQWKDYEVIDTSDGEKLERWGKYTLVRPDPQVIWNTPKTDRRWRSHDARYARSNTGGGKWSDNRLPERWQVHYGPLTFYLVYGAGDNGLMGAVARGFHKGGGKIVGVAPSFFKVDGVLFPHCTELIRTETMRQRKQIMEDKADAFIMVPGGIGTFDEFFEILTLKQLGRHTKPIIIFNQYGYYDSLLNLLDNTIKGRFMSEQSRKLWGVFDNEDELVNYLDNYKPEEFDIYALKEIDSQSIQT